MEDELIIINPAAMLTLMREGEVVLPDGTKIKVE